MSFIDRSLGYDDIALVPAFFEGSSRSSLSTSVQLGNFRFKLPVVPANMKCVIDSSVAHTLQQNGYFYVMHRFNIDAVEFVQRCIDEQWHYSSISLGVQQVDYSIIDTFVSKKITPDFITVDIAHGHCSMMRDILAHIKLKLPKAFVVAGNIATPQAYLELCRWGADAVKVGIGPGKSCITRLKTGFFTPMFTTVKNIHNIKRYGYASQPIIADGGVQHNGDIAKALAAGATMVMIGSMFAQCLDSPAPSVNGEKVYFGSASTENKGHSNNVEGRKLLMQGNGMTVLEKMREITQDLQSSISYAGGDISKADFIVIN